MDVNMILFHIANAYQNNYSINTKYCRIFAYCSYCITYIGQSETCPIIEIGNDVTLLQKKNYIFKLIIFFRTLNYLKAIWLLRRRFFERYQQIIKNLRILLLDHICKLYVLPKTGILLLNYLCFL